MQENNLNLQGNVIELTLCFIHQQPRILLGIKKRGFGVGKWNGFGGKVLSSETIEQAAKREMQEESEIEIIKMEKVGLIDFEFQGSVDVGRVHIFRVTEFTGEPVETEEMQPRWFEVSNIPFEKMWPDDKYWLPLLLKGKKFTGRFVFGPKDDILESELVETEDLK